MAVVAENQALLLQNVVWAPHFVALGIQIVVLTPQIVVVALQFVYLVLQGFTPHTISRQYTVNTRLAGIARTE